MSYTLPPNYRLLPGDLADVLLKLNLAHWLYHLQWWKFNIGAEHDLESKITEITKRVILDAGSVESFGERDHLRL